MPHPNPFILFYRLSGCSYQEEADMQNSCLRAEKDLGGMKRMKKDQGVRTKTNFGEGVHNAKWWRTTCLRSKLLKVVELKSASLAVCERDYNNGKRQDVTIRPSREIETRK
ncbi:hypothetical protein MTR_7g057850 [Medicago truncatula]|uniref:Uncharacterized protein n=1 Tax=Medicago truncatula TaxID=3880 RepID=A0A072UAF8_MEDTR|nr:hypothetical protein MTR_7g057850 [Medicago truncatula]